MVWMDMVNILMGHGVATQTIITLTLEGAVVDSRIHLANRPV
jgi:hypothetical protein